MSNTVNYYSKYMNMLDRVNKANSVFSDLEASPDSVKFSQENAQTVYLKKLSLQGLGDYSRSSGYDSGDMTISWESHTMAKDRSKKFNLDTLDSKEAMTMMAEVGAEFERVYVAPEIDAYRVHKICNLCSIDTNADLTYDTVIAAIRTGIQTLDEAEVPKEGRILYVSPEVMQLMEDSGEFYKSINVTANNNIIDTQIKGLNGMIVKQVPKARFYQEFTFTASGAGGFAVASGAEALNFMIVHKPSIIAVKRYVEIKMIENKYNADYSGTLFLYRLYHDLFIQENKLDNVYIHKRTT